jgi:hypothetical protein
MSRKLPITFALLLVACSNKPTSHQDAGPVTRAPDTPAALPAPPPPPPEPGPDPDGDDDPADTGSGPFPERARFEKVGKPPLALRRICDLTPFHGALYAAHAIVPLDMDGATITRYDPHAQEPFSVAFDWNRKGEPARNGGAGQGFLRVHAIGGRLFVPDADPPYNGFEITEPGTEGYVFVSDAAGAFAPPRMPHHKLPDEPSANRAGAGILPRAYHVLDVIQFRGRLYASTGSVPPKEKAWRGPAPGALHVANEDLSRWTYEIDYPYPWRDGVWRLTYMVRFKGRLYAGIQDYDGSDPTDYVVFEPAYGTTTITHRDVKPVRATDHGGQRTLRWYVDDGKLYWIAQSREGTRLRVTEDGNTWRAITFPKNAGAPTDVTRFRGVPVALTERGLYRLDRDPPAEVAKAPSPDGRTPFELHDLFCAAPLGVLENVLYAGSQRDGSLWRISEGP